MESESLNLLEPPGPVQDCTGTALPLLLQCNYTDPINSNLSINSPKTWHEITVGSLYDECWARDVSLTVNTEVCSSGTVLSVY